MNLCLKMAVVAVIILSCSSNVLAVKSLEHPANARLKKVIAQYSLFGAPMSAPIAVQCPKTSRSVPYAPKALARRTKHIDQVCVVGDMPYYTIVEREAAVVGVDPVVMYAIAWHETGGWRSKLWRTRRNPGGLGGPGHFRSYASEEDGIRAHAACLAKTRYDAARHTSDPYAQVAAIYAGGYCEPGYNWTAQVKRYVTRFLGRKARVQSITI
jgi:hypothetical protein